MYQLFLCLRYLRSKVFALFAVLGVAVCVWMMLTAVSVMTGFMNKIEAAARGLFGDVVIEGAGERGLAWYDQFNAVLAGGDWPLLFRMTPVQDEQTVVFETDATRPDLWALDRAGGGTVHAVGDLYLHDDQGDLLLGQVPGTLETIQTPLPKFDAGSTTRPGRTIPRFRLVPDGPLPAGAGDLSKLSLREVRFAVPAGVPSVEAAGPFILSLGMLRLDRGRNPDFRQYVQVAGIRLPGREKVTDFEGGLFVQTRWDTPSFDPPLSRVREAIDRQLATTEAVLAETNRQIEETEERIRAAHGDAERERLERRLRELDQEGYRLHTARQFQLDGKNAILGAEAERGLLRTLQEKLETARRSGASQTDIVDLQEQIDELVDRTQMELPANRAILGLGIRGLSFRTQDGATVRYLVPGHRIVLYVAPLGERISSTTMIQPNIRRFTVVDDSKTDVSSIDTKIVYVPFDTLQQLNNMSAVPASEDPNVLVTPARTSQIHIKVSGAGDEETLRAAAAEIGDLWRQFSEEFTSMPPWLRPASGDVGIDTWRQRQAPVIEPIEQQRVLVIIVLGIMSVVAVTLIFVILYTIVIQKVREIGVLKAIGASSSGVAGLFFAFGMIIGLIGSALGVVGGYFTVTNINHIQDWTRDAFGLEVFTPETHMFSQIPSEVDWTAAVVIVIGSMLAGLIGALLPAVRASRMRPVEALRYE